MLDARSTALAAMASVLVGATALTALATANPTAAQPSLPAQPAQARDASALSFRSLGAYGGSFSGVVVSGTTAFASRGSHLDAYDVADPAAPRLLGTSAHLPTVGAVQAVAGGRAYLVERKRGGDDVSAQYDQLYVVDVADAGTPVLAGMLRLPRHALRNVLAVGTRIYAASGAAGISVVDASDMARPQLLATVDMGGTITGVAAFGERLLAAATDEDGTGWLLVLDADGSGGVFVVGRVEVGARTGLVVSTGNFAFIEAAERVAGNMLQGMTTIVDLADPRLPRAVGRIELTGVQAFSVAPGRLFALEAAYGVRDNGHLWSVDTSRLPETSAVELRSVSANGIATAGDRLLLAAGARGIETLAHVDDGGEGTIVVENLLPTLGNPVGIAFEDGLAYATDGDEELWVLDVGDPAAPIALGRTTFSHPDPYRLTGFQGGPLVVRGGLVYAARRSGFLSLGGLHVFDVADPRAPAQLGMWDPDEQAANDPTYIAFDPITGLRPPELLGDRLWLSGRPALTELDVADPSSPRFVGHGRLADNAISFAGFDAGGMATDGQRLFVAAYNQGVYALDLSAGGALALGARAEMPGMVTDVAVAGSHVLAVAYGPGLRVLDADTLGAVGAIEGIQGTGIEVFGTTAYILTPDGVVAVDVADPALPMVRGTHAQPLEADLSQVAVSGDLMALAGGPSGLELVRLIPGEALPEPTIGPTLTPWPTRRSMPSPTRTPGTEPPRITPLPTQTPSGTRHNPVFVPWASRRAVGGG